MKLHKKIHVLLLTPMDGEIGGAERDWINLANALGPQAIRLSWGCVSGSECLKGQMNPEVLSRSMDLKFPVFLCIGNGWERTPRSPYLWSKILADQLLRSVRPLERLRKIMKNDPADLIVSNTVVHFLGGMYARLVRRPHFWFVKEWLDPANLTCRAYARYIEAVSRYVVVPSRAMVPIFRRKGVVIHDGNPVDKIRSFLSSTDRRKLLDELGLDDRLPVVAQVGTLIEQKGHHIAAEAVVRLARAGAPPFSMLFLGNGNEETRQRVKTILDHCPEEWRGSARIHAFAPGDYSLLATADLVIQPSVFPDPFPNAVREAMILGKPMVGSRIGGIPEIINEGRTGYLVEPGDPDELAWAISDLLANHEKRVRFGEAAKDQAMASFDIQERKDEFYNLFLQEINGNPRRSGRGH